MTPQYEFKTLVHGRRRHLVIANLSDWAVAIDQAIGPWSVYARSTIPWPRCEDARVATLPARDEMPLCVMCEAHRDAVLDWAQRCRIEWAEKHLADEIQKRIEQVAVDAPF